MEPEKEEILGRIKKVEAENQDFATRYVEIEHENNNLANLYIASYQLHSTLDFKEVLQIIIEIIINLIGGEEFALMLLDEKTNELQAVATEGIAREDVPSVKIGTGIIGQVAKTGENYFVDDVASYVPDLRESHGLHTAQDKGACDRGSCHLQAPRAERPSLPTWITNSLPCWQDMRQPLSSVPGSIPIRSGSSRPSRVSLIS